MQKMSMKSTQLEQQREYKLCIIRNYLKKIEYINFDNYKT